MLASEQIKLMQVYLIFIFALKLLQMLDFSAAND